MVILARSRTSRIHVLILRPRMPLECSLAACKRIGVGRGGLSGSTTMVTKAAVELMVMQLIRRPPAWR